MNPKHAALLGLLMGTKLYCEEKLVDFMFLRVLYELENCSISQSTIVRRKYGTVFDLYQALWEE